MVNSPIKVTNYESPIENTRKNLIDEENQKIQGNRGFIFKGFKTEKERIDEYLKNRNFYYNDEVSLNNSVEKSEEKNNNQFKSTSTIIQPQMRYKPRTDLERIYESINKNSFGKADRTIIDKQLRDLDLNVTKVNKNESRPSVPDYKDSGINLDHGSVQNHKREHSPKKPKNKYKKKEINSEAKNLMKDLHFKTHFKGVTAIANQNNSKFILINY